MIVVASVIGIGLGPVTAGADGSLLTPTAYPLLPSAALEGTGLYGATDAQFASLQNFENQAIQNTLSDHGLPQSDAEAVQTWGRADALGEMWLLITAALKEPTCTSGQTPGQGCRTVDQQNVVDWLASADQKDALMAAKDAGLEYTKWAGLSTSGWASLVAGNPSSDQITNFLCDGGTCPVNAEDYAGAVTQCPSDGSPCQTVNGTHYTEGFCVYQPPAPFQGDYSDASEPVCNGVPCPEATTCTPLGPSYDQLVKYGAADVQNQLFDTPAAEDLAREVGIGMGFAAGTAAAIVALSLAGIVVGTAAPAAIGAASTALFPFAAVAGVTLASVGALIFIAILGAIAVGFYAVQLFDAAQVPSQIATLIADAHTTPSLDGYADDTTKLEDLYSLFLGAALPAPDPGTCDGFDSAGNFCLNAPAVPAPSNVDPVFSIKQNTGTAASPTLGTATNSSTISWRDELNANIFDDSAYAHGNWFVESTTDSANTTTTSQNLRIHYLDWNGNGQSAWLVNWPTVGMKFITVPDQGSSGTPVTSTCLADHTCSVSSTIDYQGTDGKLYEASVTDPMPVVGTLHVGSAPITEGTPVQLSTTVSSPLNEALTTSWTITDKPINPPFVICLDGQGHQIPCAPPTVTVTGNPATFTFPTTGSFTVTANVRDTDGRTTSSTTTVNVSDVAPVVTIAPACNASGLLICIGTYNRTINPPGNVNLTGAVTHAGSEDIESVAVNWGDGSSTETESEQGFCYSQGSLCDPNWGLGSQTLSSGQWVLPFNGQHDYTTAGTYTVTVTSTDQTGAHDSDTLTETVLNPTTTSVVDTTGTSVFGQTVTFTATVAPTGASSPSGPPTGTVQFFDGSTVIGTGTLSTSGAATTASVSTNALSVSSGHTITADYLGDGTYQGSQSTSVSHEVDRASTSIGLGAAPNPSVFGQSVTFTATVSVTSPGAGTPSGTVEFKDGASDISSCGTVTLGVNGQAICTTSALSVATHSVTATYSGDTSFKASGPATKSDVVNKASTSTQLGTSGPTVTAGQPLTITAKVTATAPGAGIPSGTVRFFDGATSLGTGTLNAGGVASLTTSSLSLGKHTLTESYLGDSSFLASAGGPATEYVNTSLAKFAKLANGAYNLAGANLKGAVLVGVQLQGASLVNANLLGAVLIGANLQGANLTGANLNSADLTGANLTGANLTGANLNSADLMGANLTGATTHLANFNGVTWNGTTCVDGTSSSSHGGTCAGHL